LKEGGQKSRNFRILGERLFILENWFKGNAEAQELAKEIYAQFDEVFAKNPNYLTKQEVTNMIIRSYARISEENAADSLSSKLVKQLVNHHFSTAEHLKNSPTGALIDLLIFLQRPNSRLTWMRQQLLPILTERLANLPEGQLQNYIRRVINIQDTTPVNDTINVSQARRILEFLDQQENLKLMYSPLIYAAVERIINDSKLSANTGKSEDSYTKLFEKNRIEQLINQVLIKIPEDKAVISEPFIDSLIYTSVNLSETPNYFQRTLKKVITQGVPPANKKSQETQDGAAAEQTAEASNIVSTNQYIVALGAYRTFFGNPSATF
jgi:hypothetical protein